MILFHAAELGKGVLSTFSHNYVKIMKSLKYYLLQIRYQPFVQNIMTERCEGVDEEVMAFICHKPQHA